VGMDLDLVATHLYGLPPREFTSARDAAAAEARASGDRDLAAAVKKMSKPTVSAWLANLLVRKKRREVEQLVALGPSLRDAQNRLAGNDLRRLARQRQELVAALVQWAEKMARQEGERPADATLDELHETLQAALGDEQAAEALLSGRLSKALHSGGLGALDVDVRGAPDRPGQPHTARISDNSAEARKASAELDRARRQRMAAEGEVDRLERQLADVGERLSQVRGEVREARDRLRRAKREEEVVQRRAKGEVKPPRKRH
jgi:DNA repair exonuclease SbcCD ATPase subunit